MVELMVIKEKQSEKLSIGRGLRKSNTKKEAILFDIADDMHHGTKINYTLQHFKERIKQYNEQEFKYSMFTIQIE